MAKDRSYEGGWNLEVMAEAVNYNRYLRDLVKRHARDMSMILDFGAGIGTFSDSLEVTKDRITCVEPDPVARSRLAEAGYRSYADLSAIQDEHFSYVFSLNVLEHIERDDAAVAELYRVTRPGGRRWTSCWSGTGRTGWGACG